MVGMVDGWGTQGVTGIDIFNFIILINIAIGDTIRMPGICL